MVTDKGLGKEVNVVVQDGKGGGAHGDVRRDPSPFVPYGRMRMGPHILTQTRRLTRFQGFFRMFRQPASAPLLVSLIPRPIMTFSHMSTMKARLETYTDIFFALEEKVYSIRNA